MSSSGPPGELVDMHPDGKTAELNRNINGMETALTGERDLLSLWLQIACSEIANCRTSGLPDGRPEEFGEYPTLCV